MKKRLVPFLCIVSLSFTLCLAVSCKENLDPEEQAEELVTVQINAGISDSKIHFGESASGKMPVLWDENDEIAVWDGTAVRKFTVMPGSVSGSSARLIGQVAPETTDIKAFIPYSSAVWTGSAFSSLVPSEQNVSAPSDASQAVISLAEGTISGGLSFHNCASVIRFSVDKGVTKAIIQTINGEAISGTDCTSITAILPGEAGTYEVSANPGTYNGIRAFAVSSSVTTMKSSSNELKLSVCGLINIKSIMGGNVVNIISTPEELNDFLSATSSSDNSFYYISTDLDCSSTSLQQAKGFGGTLDGQHHKILNNHSGKALFAENSGNIKNLSIGSDSAITPSTDIFGSLVEYNCGTLSAISNQCDITYSSSNITDAVCLGGVAGMSSGKLTDCSNAGDITILSEEGIKAAGVGGVTGYLDGAANGCVNNGNLKIQAQHVSGWADIASPTAIPGATPSIGGIAAFSASGVSLTSCTNNGTVSLNLDGMDKMVELGSDHRMQVGGLIGSPCGTITDCVNNGPVEVSIANSSKGTALPYAAYMYAGGIGGGDFYFTDTDTKTEYPVSNTSYIRCTNNAPVTIYSDSSTGYSSVVGGIVGWPGQEDDSPTQTRECYNHGCVMLDGVARGRVGGIQGGTGNMTLCTNRGEIHGGTALQTNSSFGGCAGFHSKNHQFAFCENTGNVTVGKTVNGVGGLIGLQGNSATAQDSGCTVNCTVSCSTDASNTQTGLVIGKFNGTGKKISYGSANSPYQIAGTVNGTKVTSSNYGKLKCGSKNYSTTDHSIITTYDASSTGVSGTVIYSDGKPAAGVSVSNGFDIAVTDENGKYSLNCTPDTWYIYISYPADAKITKNTDGAPDFYKKFSSSTKTYNFSLTKQDVENKFRMITLADPQAHYQKRSGQSIADTDRFRDESVPAINSTIASSSVPCYGVSLGDIVYSQSSRNSNPGLTIMRTYFKNLTVPVFQTIGNHDYTYFWTDSELKTDATSSTLYLKAQRSFEDTFGPINYSFNRGNVHFVVLRDVMFDSSTDSGDYHCGVTDVQYRWLLADLENVSYDKKVVLCVHIPFADNKSGENIQNIVKLLSKYSKPIIFSGHAHYYKGVKNVFSSGINEVVHSAVCGLWWWSNINADGAPNGYQVYTFDDTDITDSYYIGCNTKMNTRDYQMRVYRGDLNSGGSHAHFKWPHSTSTLMINVFAGDSDWKVKVYEDGVYAGDATYMPESRYTVKPVTEGGSYTVPATSSQDWWATAYHIGVLGRGMNSTSYFVRCYHMFKYVKKNPSAKIKVEAIDSYGNVYTCSTVMTDPTYPDYIKLGNVK